jgi:hypothetical protein
VAEERGTRVVGYPALTCLLDRRLADHRPRIGNANAIVPQHCRECTPWAASATRTTPSLAGARPAGAAWASLLGMTGLMLGALPTGSRGTRWGGWDDAGPPSLPTHRQGEGGPQAQDQTMAVWHPRARVIGDGFATLQARSGGGPGEGCLAATSRSHRGRVGHELQMPEELPEHLAWRDGRDDPQHPLMAQRTRGHSEIIHPLQQPCPALARRPGASLWLVHAWLTGCRGDGTAKIIRLRGRRTHKRSARRPQCAATTRRGLLRRGRCVTVR